MTLFCGGEAASVRSQLIISVLGNVTDPGQRLVSTFFDDFQIANLVEAKEFHSTVLFRRKFETHLNA
jgi:hypothetical protein